MLMNTTFIFNLFSKKNTKNIKKTKIIPIKIFALQMHLSKNSKCTMKITLQNYLIKSPGWHSPTNREVSSIRESRKRNFRAVMSSLKSQNKAMTIVGEGNKGK